MARRDTDGPYSLASLAAVPVPTLFTRDPELLKARYIAWFEQATRRTIYPAQVEMFLIETLAYAMSLLAEEAQIAAEEHLVVKASRAGLVALGPNRSTPPLPAATARTIIRFSLAEPRSANVLVDAGSRVSADAGGLIFVTLAPAVIAAGALQAEVPAEADQAGAIGNGYLPGQIATMLDPVAGVAAANTVTSEGGADPEDAELYRLRVANAFDRVSPGGGLGWYTETTVSVSSAIIDVAVIRPQPCFVDIYPLTPAGAAGPALRDQVKAAFDTREALDIRFGDEVTVKAAVAVPIACNLTIWLRGETAGARSAAASVANNVLDGWGQQLGAAVAPGAIEGEVKSVLKDLGFHVLDAQVSGMAFQQLAPEEFAVAVLLDPDDVVVEVVA
ncbi:baseplate J/gp47 family protein [Bosea sp. TWI1241]|uniref:baseplate J/gp47 family protein n=1 Tax=Bosea sp. TWI1241 TaxID=3148904 RepID=UPI00320B92EB